MVARDAAINVRTLEAVRDAVDAAAKAEGRSRAQWVERTLVAKLMELDLLPRDAPTVEK